MAIETSSGTAPRVVIDSRLMYYRKAGIAQYTRHLVQALAANGVGAGQLTILLDRRDTDTAWVPAGANVIRTITPAHHKYERLTLPLELALAHARTGFDVLHSPDFITARGPFRKVITIHDLYFLEHPEAMSTDGARYYGRVRWSATHADHIIAVSTFTRSEILRLLPGVAEEKISVVVEAGAEENTEARGEKQEVRNESQDAVRDSALRSPYALFVGTFEPRKNLVTLLRALKDLPEDFRLVIVGESGWGDNEPSQVAAALGVAGRVTLAGRLSNEQLDTCYRGARLLAFPSLSEGFGLPALEAMARGVPVVCSNAGALPEVVGDAALLHDPLDAAALARLMRMMWISDAVHDDYARRGRQRASQFTWSRAARETWAVYLRACEGVKSKT
jgi:glycosyltransferase involved in cell wall biosynthesis